MNFEEEEIINEIYNLYKLDNTIDINKELCLIIYDIVNYNDDDNIKEIINNYGGICVIMELYNNNYKNKFNNIELDLQELMAFIGIYNYIYYKIEELILIDKINVIK